MGDQNSVPPLTSLYFYMTEGCNLACKHCWIAPKFDKEGSKYPTIAVKLFKEVIEEAKPLGLQTVKLTGGEPLLHPHIREILDIVNQAELSLILETNGLLCNTKIAEKIAELPKPFVSVSLDGTTAEVHEKIRGVSGAFDRTVTGIKNLVNNGINTQIIFSIMADNIHQYEAIIQLAESLGVNSLKYNIIQPTERGQILHEQDRDISIEEYIEIGKRISGEFAETTALTLLYDHPMAFRPLHKLADPLLSGGVCGIRNVLGVLADGTYALCGIGTSLAEMHFGRAGEDSLESVWKDNAMLNTIRYDLPGKFTGICTRCLMKTQCLGACVAQNYYRTRDIHAPFWYCEEAEKKGLFPETRMI